VLLPVRWLVRGLGKLLSLMASPLTLAYGWIEGLYPRLLRVALKARIAVLVIAAGLCALSVEAAQGLGRTLIPELQQGEFFVQLALPQGSALTRTAGLAGAVADAVGWATRIDQVFARVGSMTAGDSATGTVQGTHLAQVNVRLKVGLDELAGGGGRGGAVRMDGGGGARAGGDGAARSAGAVLVRRADRGAGVLRRSGAVDRPREAAAGGAARDPEGSRTSCPTISRGARRSASTSIASG
jgi:hypothetical protein